jgi:hypothetical protein
MNTAAGSASPDAEPSALAVFIARADARAVLWRCGELSLHEAVDGLQAAAVNSGLIAEFGQDEVQAILADAFVGIVAPVDWRRAALAAWQGPSWKQAATEYHNDRRAKPCGVVR